MSTHASACTCRECCTDRAAQLLVDAVAARDAMSPRDAAIAAGARTEPEITRLEQRIRTDRATALQSTA